MCGIQLTILKKDSPFKEETIDVWNKAYIFNSKRGPDHSRYMSIKSDIIPDFEILIGAHVLNLRGANTIQPLVDENSGDVFCWNGEVFGGLEKREGLIWYARDFLGRRSLLQHFDFEKNIFHLSSTGFEGNSSEFWKEVETPYIHCINLKILNSNNCDLNALVSSHKWQHKDEKLINNNPSLPYQRTNVKVDLSEHVKSQLSNYTQISEYEPTEATKSNIDKLHRVLMESVKIRVNSSPGAGISVLFSGGLDCMVLAALAHTTYPIDEPIELINVSFENPRILKDSIKKNKIKTKKVNAGTNSIDATDFSQESIRSKKYKVPDRVTGLMGLNELRKVYPERSWNWIEVNVEYDQVLKHKSHIIDLLGPNYTVMDLEVFDYKSKSKVLILGMGADEQFGGYRRDDRIISDHGKEARFPFLDEEVVDFLNGLQVDEKMDMRLGKGFGDKLLLRLLAYKLGLVCASMQPKRAIQFGARTAKMESSKDKGATSL
ncbi:Asparagine synthetase domain-containing protein 1 [Smittium culicis]|uniref:Asparagine synthetase domain-containing protein 1 n=1 Tax=Smittium culicis TaxID=133412 RepID=A0A1R1XQ78_9FUNG|nr:Asparagine synthetase domain-containing protein 1 [Smittium culicis]